MQGSLLKVIKAFILTLKYIFTPAVTERYPEVKKRPYPRFRGKHILKRDEKTGRERCVGCSLCAKYCPTQTIFVQGADDPEQKISISDRYALIYEIDLTRCIFCGYCQDACPEGAIFLTSEYELSQYSREKCILTKEDLLEKKKNDN